jgi:hypothetical protein
MEERDEESAKLWSLSFAVASAVAILYRVSFGIEKFNDFIGNIAEKLDSVIIVWPSPTAGGGGSPRKPACEEKP